MSTEKYKSYLLGNNIDNAEQKIDFIKDAENYLMKNSEDFSQSDIPQYINYLVENNMNSLLRFESLAEYFYFLGKNDIYVYFTKILGGIDVIKNIKKRMYCFSGEEITEKIFSGIEEPVLGEDFAKIPEFTNSLMERMEKYMHDDDYKFVLAANNHGLSEKYIEKEKEYYKNSASFESYLKDRHKRKIDELRYYMENNKVWFEQIITEDVINFVENNQEILSGRIENNKLYVTKIPYDTSNFLKAEDSVHKRYYSCHCPFARESILKGKVVSGNWCYCSAGFAKFPFEIILGKSLKVKVIESALFGDELCRFEIEL